MLDLNPALSMALRGLEILSKQVKMYGKDCPMHLQLQLEAQQEKVNELEARMGLPVTEFEK